MSTQRKTPHFFIINPMKDRRIETRFESIEKIQVRIEDTGEIISGSASDIGEHGLKLSCSRPFAVGESIQIVFPDHPENIGCFGRVAWCNPAEEGSLIECGLAIDSWHGIVQGLQSWKKFKGIKPRRDRRRKER